MLKSFSKLVSECRGVNAPTKDTFDIEKEETRHEINRNFLKQLSHRSGFDSPEVAISTVRRVLETYGVSLPKVDFYSNDTRESTTHVEQFGVNKNDGNEYFLYFTYDLTKFGTYECFAYLTDENGLNELLEGEDL